LRTASDSFFEQMGTSWGLGGRNWFFRFGGAPATPPFGGAQPGAGIAGGVGLAGGGGNGGLGFMAAQGSQRSNVMQAGNLTLFNGFPGFVGDASQSPFVTGIVPIVGQQAKVPWQQQWRGDIPKQIRESADTDLRIERNVAPAQPPGAQQDDPGRSSLEELRRRRESADAARQQEALAHLAKAHEALAAGKSNVARIYFQMAFRRAEGALRQRIASELDALQAAPPKPQR
jgi:hypothetical protein